MEGINQNNIDNLKKSLLDTFKAIDVKIDIDDTDIYVTLFFRNHFPLCVLIEWDKIPKHYSDETKNEIIFEKCKLEILKQYTSLCCAKNTAKELYKKITKLIDFAASRLKNVSIDFETIENRKEFILRIKNNEINFKYLVKYYDEVDLSYCYDVVQSFLGEYAKLILKEG